MKLKAIFLLDQFGYFAVRVIQVAEGQSPGLAGIDAGRSGLTVYARFQPFGQSGIDSFHAEIAFFGGAGDMRIKLPAGFLKTGPLMPGEVAGIFIFGEEGAVLVGAGDDAVAAADTFIIIYIDDAVLPFLGGFGRTDIDAGGFFALVAADRDSVVSSSSGYVGFPGDQAAARSYPGAENARSGRRQHRHDSGCT